MKLSIAVMIAFHVVLTQNLQRQKSGKESVIHNFVTQFMMCAIAYIPIQLTVWKEQIMPHIAATHAWTVPQLSLFEDRTQSKHSLIYFV